MTDDPVARLVALAGPRPAAPAERLARIRENVHDAWQRGVDRDRRRRRMLIVGLPLAVAAAAAIVFVATLRHVRDAAHGGESMAATIVRVEGGVVRLDGRAGLAGGTIAAGSGLETDTTGRVALLTSDGVGVRIGSLTRVRFQAPGVVELERGVVYLDTGSPGGREAIAVLTRLGRVTDVGTRFEVRLTEDRLQVSVRAGVTRWAGGGRTASAPAGTRLRIAADGVPETGPVAADDPDWAWAEAIAPPFEPEGKTLGAYLDWLEGETGWRVVLADPAAAGSMRGIVLHGSTARVAPRETPEVILPVCGLRSRIEGATLVVERVASGDTR